MRLSISNIGWTENEDKEVYSLMKKYSFSGLEIAPTRVFPTEPYSDLGRARNWAKELKTQEGLDVSSMQSIWYGRSESIFGTIDERKVLLDYTKKAIDFAEAIGCKNLVFGCPRNRSYQLESDLNIAIGFFKELGDYAYEHSTVIGMEANPPIYNTNYINNTESAIELINMVDSKGFKLNLDVGTMIQNDEEIEILKDNIKQINHVHISEPYLKVIQERKIHREIIESLLSENYQNYISIEMGKVDNTKVLDDVMKYVSKLVDQQ